MPQFRVEPYEDHVFFVSQTEKPEFESMAEVYRWCVDTWGEPSDDSWSYMGGVEAVNSIQWVDGKFEFDPEHPHVVNLFEHSFKVYGDRQVQFKLQWS